VVVAPKDARIFSAQAFVFAELNEDAVTDLLGRTLPDGGGNTFYNLTLEGGPQTRGWMQVLGTLIDVGAFGAAPSLHASSGGLEGGADVALGSAARLGAAIGYESGRFTDGDGGLASQDVFRASLYGSDTVGPLGLSAALSYAHGWEHAYRQTGIGQAYASRGGDGVSLGLQASAPFDTGGLTVTPSAGVVVSYVTASAFAETAPLPAFALTGAASNVTTASPFVQLGLSRAMTTGSGLVITPDIEVGYRYDGASDGGPVTLTAADQTVFTGNRYEPSHGGALLGASLTAHKGRWTAYAKYRATVANGWTDQHLDVGLRVAF